MNAPKFEQWAIVEIMGHVTEAGRVSEEVIAGAALLRVDVPLSADDTASFRTVYYGSSALYALHVVDEATARAMAVRSGPPPLVYRLENAARAASRRMLGRDSDED